MIMSNGIRQIGSLVFLIRKQYLGFLKYSIENLNDLGIVSSNLPVIINTYPITNPNKTLFHFYSSSKKELLSARSPSRAVFAVNHYTAFRSHQFLRAKSLRIEGLRLASPEQMMNSTWRPEGEKFPYQESRQS